MQISVIQDISKQCFVGDGIWYNDQNKNSWITGLLEFIQPKVRSNRPQTNRIHYKLFVVVSLDFCWEFVTYWLSSTKFSNQRPYVFGKTKQSMFI